MKLLRLVLENFQGVKFKEIDFNGHSASIYGNNATGKTTVFNAMTWLMFDKASTGIKNFTPKTIIKNEDAHFLNHSVEGVFTIDHGEVISFKKTYKEVYKKKRGSANEEFDGHTTDYYIDGVPTKESEYTETLKNTCTAISFMKTLSSPNYFPEELTWEDRRKILLDVGGDITDEEIISSTKELLKLKEFLKKPGAENQFYKVDEYKKIAKSKQQEVNKQLQEIPSRIDEATKAMPDTGNQCASELNDLISDISEKISKKELEKHQITNADSATNIINNEIFQLKTEINLQKSRFMEQHIKLNEARFASIEVLQGNISKLKVTLSNIESKIKSQESDIQNMKNMRTSLIENYSKLREKVWDGLPDCPTCKRPLPESDIKSAIEAFNSDKAKRLEEINTKGSKECSGELIETAQSNLSLLVDEQNSLMLQINEHEKKLNIQLHNTKPTTTFEETDEYRRLHEQIKKLQYDVTQAETLLHQKTQFLLKDVEIYYKKINEIKENLLKFEIKKTQEERINALKLEEKRLSEEYERLEQGMYLCETFIKAKVIMLTEKINDKFKTVRFRLFINQVNGGLKEDCEVLVDCGGQLVPYATANNAGRINAGLEIIDVLSAHWGFCMPVFVDNAESVTQIINIGSQLIRLVVSESDSYLRVVIDTQPENLKSAI